MGIDRPELDPKFNLLIYQNKYDPVTNVRLYD